MQIDDVYIDSTVHYSTFLAVRTVQEKNCTVSLECVLSGEANHACYDSCNQNSNENFQNIFEISIW